MTQNYNVAKLVLIIYGGQGGTRTLKPYSGIGF